MRVVRNIYILSLVIASWACRKPYNPKVVASPGSYLVVEGVINPGSDSTIIKLSRTVNISGSTAHNPEGGANVLVVSDDNMTYPLQEMGNGKYFAVALNLDTAHKYHLYIKVASGKEYTSDPEPVTTNPPIDSVNYTTTNDGIQLYVNTHNPKNNTRYYRWEYTETWQFNVKYPTPFITDGTKLNFRRPDQQISSCFGNDSSSTILLGSSAALSQDIIYQAPVTNVISTSEKLEFKYSILLKQYGLTANAYNFWQNLKKNTQQIGTIFDPQPSTIQGNIHCITIPSEPVIGYVSVTNIQRKRIFIKNGQLPQQWMATYPYECRIDTFLFDDHGTNDVALWLLPQPPHYFAIDGISDQDVLVGYLGVSAECADCTIRGTTKKPDFWIDE